MKLLLVFFILFPLITHATSQTSTVVIMGNVDTFYSLQVSPLPKSQNLEIRTGESQKLIAYVMESANHEAGYKIRLSSQNNGSLVHNADPSRKINYVLSYNGSPNFKPKTEFITVKESGPLSAPTVQTSAVTISFSGWPQAVSGEYADTVYFEISAP